MPPLLRVDRETFVSIEWKEFCRNADFRAPVSGRFRRVSTAIRNAILKSIIIFCLFAVNVSLAREGTERGGVARFLDRIEAKSRDYKSGGSVVIVAFGDSITMGATAKDTLEPEAVYHARLKGMLEKRFPNAVFSVINSGIGGDTAADGLRRLERDVILFQPDLVLVAFGANGLGADPEMASAYQRDLEKIVRGIREKTPADVILLTTPFMASQDNPIALSGQREQLQRLIGLQTTGAVKRFAKVVKNLGAKENIPVADVYGAWEVLANSGTDTTALLANGLNHPAGSAHEIAAMEVFRVIDAAAKGTGTR